MFRYSKRTCSSDSRVYKTPSYYISTECHYTSSEKDAELCIIQGLLNHDPEHKIKNISNKQYQNQKCNTGLCHGCSGSCLIKDCKDSVCKRCRPNLDNHAPARCPRKRSPNRQQWLNPSYSNNPPRHQPNGHNDPNLQLCISKSKPDHIEELLETTKKMTRYFKKSYKSNKSQHTNNNNNYPCRTHNSSLPLDKHTCRIHNPSDQVCKITGQT